MAGARDHAAGLAPTEDGEACERRVIPFDKSCVIAHITLN
ncbi:hypothetical protein GGE16_003184 [Rhizobium leguminosarum]|uniref:Uncharacterized protein n=1 Tax=Rhizobium leguminosarum TaxID=384 RepID=A0AAE2ML49_RHILE|nr:hypothetical protein [Rhizobium leguminosarum]MBB4430278.1 hypothetical protein [Rhizobium esperanzae]MBB4297779.1 hypothetical protein [Rhizobium leguminosarum]MBB4308918.1 hypothetical protein [Rhizobium leguminosarum]MBB4416754.1 hypothetical protein [Rhizobium leguminosarum]